MGTESKGQKYPQRVRKVLIALQLLLRYSGKTSDITIFELPYLKYFERVNDYTTIYTELRRSPESKILVPASGTFQRGASAAVAQSVPPAKRLFQTSPIIYLKAMKNDAELSVAKTVDDTRETQAGYIGNSMKTRVAFSTNGAEPEYRPTAVSNKRIFKNATLVVHSGGQYAEGTTVVTRTVHFGIPTREERRAYTTVLRSMAALAMLSMPAELAAAHADPVARAPIWNAKQDYVHPTGYGVGSALNRREDPVVIDYRYDTNLHTFSAGYFVTAGWYDVNKFGVRLGNILEVEAKPNGYLGFTVTTLLPYEPKLIERSLLTEYEINWLNSYNARIRKIVGPELKAQGLTDVLYWMMNKT
ncbi:Xaa-pro aminopeptidase, partial [Operophtera brumata]